LSSVLVGADIEWICAELDVARRVSEVDENPKLSVE
jgi:hypothetical protein